MKTTSPAFRLLTELRNYGWMTREQMDGLGLYGSRGSTTTLLSRLCREGYVESVNIRMFNDQYFHDGPIRIAYSGRSLPRRAYRLGPLGVKAMGRTSNLSDHPSLLGHQLLLNQMKCWLLESFPGAGFIPEHVERERVSKEDIYSDFIEEIPDLVMEWEGSCVAVEIERKGRRGLSPLNAAYEERFASQVLRYDYVIYAVQDERSYRLLLGKAQGLSNIGFLHFSKPDYIQSPGRPIARLGPNILPIAG